MENPTEEHLITKEIPHDPMHFMYELDVYNI